MPISIVPSPALYMKTSVACIFGLCVKICNGLEIPPGVFYGPNLTPDLETEIGRYTDSQLYRMMRYNIRPDGQAAIELMPFINMSDEDICAVIAYLRSQDAIKNEMPERELTFLGKMLFAMKAIKPGVPQSPVPARVNQDTTAEYGRYLAYSVANCMGCHTERDMQTGEFVGADFAGGMQFGPDILTKDWVFYSPNITPDKQTGVMSVWDEESFIDRMRAGKLYETSPMPWSAYAKMGDNDLKALFRFLQTVEPVARTVSQVAQPPSGR